MRRTLVTALLVTAVVVCHLPASQAYTTTHLGRVSTTGSAGFLVGSGQTDFCTTLDPGSYTTMPTSATIQAKIMEAMSKDGITATIPVGGGTFQATCTGTLCNWKWFRGLYYYRRPTFFNGVYYTGPASSAISSPINKVAAVPGSYTNWDASFPISWSNLSYYGKRLVVLQPTTGKWKNVEIATQFKQWVCEHYTYTNSDGTNGFIPTFPGGSGIPLVSDSRHVYSYCGHDISKDSQGRWILPECNKKFPWWAGLVIAVAAYVIVVALIIAIWCCCCVSRRNKEEKRRRQIIGSERDNTGHIPNQSEVGLSRTASSFGDTYSSGSGGSHRRSSSASSLSESSSTRSSSR